MTRNMGQSKIKIKGDKMDKNLVMITNNTSEEIKTNFYLKQQHKELDKSIKTVFGLLDAEANKTRTLNMRVAFLNSILYNILQRACLFELSEDEFINYMNELYRINWNYKNCNQ